MKTHQLFLVTAFVILASGTILASFVERDKAEGVLSEIKMGEGNKVVLRFEGDSCSYYVSRKYEMININHYNSRYIGKLFQFEYNKPLFFDTYSYPVVSLTFNNVVVYKTD
ncbi:MAG: hypothetical protein M0Q53_21030 [Prolixibacteraceae bacterium]|jgi:hypothetical protein|nr:hypothetical protein [uncultured Macellibacteroides sp.]MCK9414794.1 hypothetical protein [Prolixibacteraceae bacterium]